MHGEFLLSHFSFLILVYQFVFIFFNLPIYMQGKVSFFSLVRLAFVCHMWQLDPSIVLHEDWNTHTNLSWFAWLGTNSSSNGWIHHAVSGFLQGSCVNAPMITVADYSNGSEAYTYNYYVSRDYCYYIRTCFLHQLIKNIQSLNASLMVTVGRCYSKESCGDSWGTKKRGKATGKSDLPSSVHWASCLISVNI